jgi:hypothetical protein
MMKADTEGRGSIWVMGGAATIGVKEVD